MTNRQVLRNLRLGLVCEWNPEEERPALLSDPFHAVASTSLGLASKNCAAKDRKLRLCRNCRNDHAAQLYTRTKVENVWRAVKP